MNQKLEEDILLAAGDDEKTWVEMALELRELGHAQEDLLRGLAQLADRIGMWPTDLVEVAIALFKN